MGEGDGIRSLHYTPSNALTMPMLARLIYEADKQVYPNDSKFRDIAKEVFQQRELWNEKIILQAPDIGGVFKDLQNADSRTLSRAILQHAEELRIPSTTVRLIKPRLITATRRIDDMKPGQAVEIKEITEHYLEYTYEYTQMVSDFFSGELVGFAAYGGGTLVMDENWNAVLLATYPELYQEDPPGVEGTMQAWTRTRENFDRIHGEHIQKTLAARNENRGLKDRPVIPGCPFVVQRSETGAYRLVCRCCNLQEHFKAIAFTKHGIAHS